MITQATRQGLIVSTRSQATAALDKLIACCGWPVLLHATPRRLHRELSLGTPKLSLFWLDSRRDLAATIQLLRWLGTHERVVRRIAVAYRLPTDVEVAVRSTGAHLYQAADDNIGALVRGWMPCWLRSQGRDEPALRPFALDPPPGLQTALEADLRSREPP